MGLFDFFGKRKPPTEKIQEVAQKPAHRELKRPRRGVQRFLFGSDPQFTRDMSGITQSMRRDVYEDFRQQQKRQAPILERQRERYSYRLSQQVNIPGLEKQL